MFPTDTLQQKIEKLKTIFLGLLVNTNGLFEQYCIASYNSNPLIS